MRLDDPAAVREEYADESRLAARTAAYRQRGGGPDPREMVLEAVAATKPRHVLEVGPGEGELAQRMEDELG